jgi:hypothetical protein
MRSGEEMDSSRATNRCKCPEQSSGKVQSLEAIAEKQVVAVHEPAR